jgi:hypothetical protein
MQDGIEWVPKETVAIRLEETGREAAADRPRLLARQGGSKWAGYA